jgi:parallel beta-helix repeat protein
MKFIWRNKVMSKFAGYAKVAVLTALVALLSASTGWATTYYVDFVGGSDFNAGTSTSTPLKHSPGDNNGSGTAGSINLSPGDKVIFKGGVQYNGRIDIDWSGTSDGDIIYQGNTDTGDWGIGKAIIDGQNTRYRGFFTTSGRNHITIKNFEIRNMASGGLGIGFLSSSSSSSYVRIEDCYIHEIGQWDNNAGISGGGIRIYLPSNCTVNNNEITKTANVGVGLHGARNCTVSNNRIHDYINWGIDISSDYRQAMDNVISDNVLYDMYQYDEGFWRGGGSGPHTDYIFIRKGGDGGGLSNPAWAHLRTVVERNTLYNSQDFTNFGGTAMITVARSQDVVIRNNVIINPHNYYAVNIGWESWTSGVKVHNNTVYAPRQGCTALRIRDGYDHDISNNIIIADRIIYLNGTVTSDNNLFYAGSASAWHWGTWSSWQGQGYDTNSLNMPDISGIGFVSTSGYPLSCQDMNLQVRHDSPAIDWGIALIGFSEDRDGTLRPQGAAWDIGAYEYADTPVGDTMPPAPPTGLEILR